MSRESRRNLWFGAAWCLMVLVVVFGFWVQAGIIRELKDRSDAADILLHKADLQRQSDIAAICRITVELHPEQRDEVIAAFATAGVPCSSADTVGP